MAHIEAIPSYHEALASAHPGSVDSARVPPPLCEHIYRHKELSVTLSSYARSPKATPIFYPNSSIEGTVALTLTKPRTPSFIRVTVQCGVERVNQGFRNRTNVDSFDLERFKAVWSASTMLYSHSSSTNKAGLGAGAHIYPFKFDIPKKVKLESSKVFNHSVEEVDLPPNFVETGYPLTIQWVLLAEVKFGFMKMDRDIPIKFRHIPITRAASYPSPTIQSAYLLGTPMPTPSDDADAFSTHPVVVAGTLFGQQFILQCWLSLPRPLVYASSTRIPYFITISSPHADADSDTPANAHAVDILLLSHSTTVLLSREVKLEGQLTYTFVDGVANGRSWSKRDNREGAGRLLQGEIEVPAGTPTDFAFPAITVSHSLELLVNAPGLVITTTEPPAQTPPGRTGQVILSVPIKLVNATMTGIPKPPSYAPVPGYNDEPEALASGPIAPSTAPITIAAMRAGYM